MRELGQEGLERYLDTKFRRRGARSTRATTRSNRRAFPTGRPMRGRRWPEDTASEH